MAKKFVWSSYRQKTSAPSLRVRSKRLHEYDLESAGKVRRKVFLAVVVLAAIYLVYFLVYTKYFRFADLNVTGQTDIDQQRVTELIWQNLHQFRGGIFPNDNYFFFSSNRIVKAFDAEALLVDLSFVKKFPHTLNVTLKQKLGHLVWISSERYYVINLEGLVEKQLPIKELVNANVPLVYDLSNTILDIGFGNVNQQLVDLILEVYATFNNYNLPAINLDYFKVDNPQANYVKIVAKEGFEIHVNYLSSLAGQLEKLKKSLAAGKIDLKGINYINLRIENQVIYK